MVPLKYAYLALTTMITSPMTIVLPVRLYVRALSMKLICLHMRS